MQQFLELTISGIVLGGIYSLISLGLALPLNTFRIVNLGHGALALSGPLLILSMNRYEPLVSWWVKILILINLWIILWHLGFRHMYSGSTEDTESKAMGILVIGVGILSIVEDIASKIAIGGAIFIPLYSKSIDLFGISTDSSKIVLSILLLGIYILTHLLLNYTDFGKSVIALSEDKSMATLLGINSKCIYLTVYFFSFILTVISGLALAAIIPLEPQSGLLLTIKALIIISLSRQFCLMDVFIIAVFFGVLETFVDFFLGNAFKNILVNCSLLLALKIKDTIFSKHEEIFS